MTTLYWLRQSLPVSRWAVAGAAFAVVALVTMLCARWSHSRHWGPAHRLALAGGALLTYAWLGFLNAQALPVPAATALTGSVVFGTGAIVLLIMAVWRIRQAVPPARAPGPAAAR